MCVIREIAPMSYSGMSFLTWQQDIIINLLIIVIFLFDIGQGCLLLMEFRTVSISKGSNFDRTDECSLEEVLLIPRNCWFFRPAVSTTRLVERSHRKGSNLRSQTWKAPSPRTWGRGIHQICYRIKKPFWVPQTIVLCLKVSLAQLVLLIVSSHCGANTHCKAKELFIHSIRTY